MFAWVLFQLCSGGRELIKDEWRRMKARIYSFLQGFYETIFRIDASISKFEHMLTLASWTCRYLILEARSKKPVFNNIRCDIESESASRLLETLLIFTQFWSFLPGGKLHSFLYRLVDFHLNWGALNYLNIRLTIVFLSRNAITF